MLQNEPPLDMPGVWVQIPFMASLIQTRSRGWPLKGFGSELQTYQVGAYFEALDEGVNLVPLDPRYTQVGFNLISVQVCAKLDRTQLTR